MDFSDKIVDVESLWNDLKKENTLINYCLSLGLPITINLSPDGTTLQNNLTRYFTYRMRMFLQVLKETNERIFP